MSLQYKKSPVLVENLHFRQYTMTNAQVQIHFMPSRIYSRTAQ